MAQGLSPRETAHARHLTCRAAQAEGVAGSAPAACSRQGEARCEKRAKHSQVMIACSTSPCATMTLRSIGAALAHTTATYLRSELRPERARWLAT